MFFLSSLIWGTRVFAATTLTVTNVPNLIDQAQEFSVDVSLLCSGCSSDSFLRSVFYPSGTSYFGYTADNGGNWINAPGGSCTQYFKILSGELTEGSWSGKLKVKPDTANTFYTGPGDYLFKVGRYTASCGAPVWSPETTVTITGPTPTPSPTPPLPTPTPTCTPTPIATPTPTPTPTRTPTVSPTPTPTPTISITPSSTGVSVLGVTDEFESEDFRATESSEITNVNSEATNQTPSVTPYKKSYISLALALLLISIGTALAAVVVIIRIMTAPVRSD